MLKCNRCFKPTEYKVVIREKVTDIAICLECHKRALKLAIIECMERDYPLVHSITVTKS